MSFLSQDLGLPLATTAALVGGGGLLWLTSWWWSSRSSVPLVPRAPVSMWQAMQGMGGDENPFWVLSVAQSMGAWNFRVFLPVGPMHIIGECNLVRAMLQDPASDKPRHVYQHFEGMGGKTMFTSSNKDPYCKAMRKATAHAFSNHQVGRMNQVARTRVAEWMTDRLDQFAQRGEAFDPSYELNLITFRVICEAAFEYHGTEQEFQTFEHWAELAAREFIGKAPMNPLRRIFGRFLPDIRAARSASLALVDFAGKVLDAYRQKPDKSAQKTLIKILNDSQAVATEKQRKAEIKDWLVAGHDTTGYSLSSILVLLAKYPAVQSKLRRALTNADYEYNPQECDYFRHVVKECMRVMPVAAGGSGRVTGKDYLTADGKMIRQGSTCFFNQYLMNHNPNVYDEPDEFRPERWESPTEAMKTAMAPFALGSRACPGQSLATAEINSLLPRILAKYSFDLVDEGKKQYFLTLKFKGARVKATKL